MRAEALEKLVDRPVKDTYGRYVGFVVGFSVDTSGELKSVGVDQGNGEFTEYPSRRVVTSVDGFVLIPAWKIASDSLVKEVDGVRKRVKALQDLAREGEVPASLHDELMSKYTEEASKVQDSYKSLTEEMAVRVGELEGQREALDRFLVNIKVQFRAGEIDEAAYKVATESCQAMQKRNAQEMDELTRMLRAASEPLEQRQPHFPQPEPPAEPTIEQTVQATAE